MNILSNVDYNLLTKVLSTSTVGLQKALVTTLKRKYQNVIETKDYIFAEGDIPIALVSHLDTVFPEPPKEIFYDRQKNVMWSPQGLGADDRAGVFAILQVLKEGLKPHIIFTLDEEIGGWGALRLSQLDCPFKNLKYIIELDRHGSNDCVFYNCDNPDFEKYIEDFGFVTNFGTYTDICELCPAWEVAGVNLSVGYRDEHSYEETLFVGQLLSTIKKIKKMLIEQNVPCFKYIPATNYNYQDILNYKGKRTKVEKCHSCGRYFVEDDMYPVILQSGKRTNYCFNCLEKVAWCTECQSAFEKYSPEQDADGICPKCLERKTV